MGKNCFYDFLIVGAGLFGATFAYRAKLKGKSCLVIDKRSHLGGNVYCENIEGINVHKYGAHIFHTNNKAVWDLVNSIVEFNRYTNSPIANYKGELYNLPFNMNTFNRIWPDVKTPEQAIAKIDEQKAEAIAAPKVEVDLANVQLTDNLAVGVSPTPSSAEETVSAPVAEQKTAVAENASWLSRGMSRIKQAFSGFSASQPLSVQPIALINETAINDAALKQALGLSGSGTLSMGGLGDLTNKINNNQIIKRVHRTLELARNQADSQFITMAKEAQKTGRYLTSKDYNSLLSEKFSSSIAQDPKLAPYAKDIAAALSSPAATVPTPAKRELAYSLKIHDADGKVLPITFELNMRLLDNTAVRQFELLGITNSEVFTLMRDIKDGKPTGPFELMLTTPGGSRRPIYDPFIEGGKAGVEALYYRLLGDYQAGKLVSNKVNLNLYSDVFAERATMSPAGSFDFL